MKQKFGNGVIDEIKQMTNISVKRIDKQMRQVYYCKEKNCNKKIHYTTYKYGTGFCSSHAAKNEGIVII